MTWVHDETNVVMGALRPKTKTETKTLVLIRLGTKTYATSLLLFIFAN